MGISRKYTMMTMSHVQLLGMEKPLNCLKNRENLINFVFQKDHSRLKIDNRSGNNKSWQEIKPMSDNGDLFWEKIVEMGRIQLRVNLDS